MLRREIDKGRSRADAEKRANHQSDHTGYRLGSSWEGARLCFHRCAILLPPRIVDYVVAHELMHLCGVHHTQAFRTRLERVMPDFTARKQWLAAHGAGAVLGV